MCEVYYIYYCIVCTSNLVLVSFLFLSALYFTLKLKDVCHLLVSSLLVLSNVIVEDIVGLYTCTRQSYSLLYV